jgi:hypothetical protein
MADVKGAGIFTLRRMFNELGKELELPFLQSLTPDERIETELAIYLKAVAIMSPQDENAGLRAIGRRMGTDAVNSFYRVIIKFTNVPFIISKAGQLWHAHHKQGIATAEQIPGENRILFHVQDYPTLPERIRELLCGYMEALALLTSIQHAKVYKVDRDPKTWEWVVLWR